MMPIKTYKKFKRLYYFVKKKNILNNMCVNRQLISDSLSMYGTYIPSQEWDLVRISHTSQWEKKESYVIC